MLVPSTVAGVFTPRSHAELKVAVGACIEISPNCTWGPNGPIGSWDVSSVTDMRGMFYHMGSQLQSFNGDLSKWDVSSVTDMRNMFRCATSFNGDLSQWDVSKVLKWSQIFERATSYQGGQLNWVLPTLKSTKTCPKCGTFERSGRRSCCAEGGSWFNKCGSSANSEHSWIEGSDICKSKLMFYEFVVFCLCVCLTLNLNTIRYGDDGGGTRCSRMPLVYCYQQSRQNELLCVRRFLVQQMWQGA